MKTEPRKQSFLLSKRDIFEKLGYSSMTMIYKKILTEEIIKELGFKSMKEFKQLKKFNLHQSRILREFLNHLITEQEDKGQ